MFLILKHYVLAFKISKIYGKLVISYLFSKVFPCSICNCTILKNDYFFTSWLASFANLIKYLVLPLPIICWLESFQLFSIDYNISLIFISLKSDVKNFIKKFFSILNSIVRNIPRNKISLPVNFLNYTSRVELSKLQSRFEFFENTLYPVA